MAIAPFRSSDALNDFDTFFDTFLGRARPTTGQGVIRMHATDVVERENDIQVLMEMPGIDREDIEMDLENNMLTIRGEKREVYEDGKEGKYHLAERRYGSFTRSFLLPRDVEADDIRAELSDGVLTVTIPKSERSRRRRIEISGGESRHRIEGESESA